MFGIGFFNLARRIPSEEDSPKKKCYDCKDVDCVHMGDDSDACEEFQKEESFQQCPLCDSAVLRKVTVLPNAPSKVEIFCSREGCTFKEVA